MSSTNCKNGKSWKEELVVLCAMKSFLFETMVPINQISSFTAVKSLWETES